MGESGGGAGASGCNITWVGIKAALAGRVFLLPLVEALGNAQVQIQDPDLACDGCPWGLWLLHPTKGQIFVQQRPTLRNLQVLTWL